MHPFQKVPVKTSLDTTRVEGATHTYLVNKRGRVLKVFSRLRDVSEVPSPPVVALISRAYIVLIVMLNVVTSQHATTRKVT